MKKNITIEVEYEPGDIVRLMPYPDIEGIVRCIYWDNQSVMYSVGYFNNSGERRIESFYDFELGRRVTKEE